MIPEITETTPENNENDPQIMGVKSVIFGTRFGNFRAYFLNSRSYFGNGGPDAFSAPCIPLCPQWLGLAFWTLDGSARNSGPLIIRLKALSP